jgi:hypothetical protein
MSHWAELNSENVVIRVLVGDNNDPNGDEGYQWLIDNLGGTWVKTSYNATINRFRKNYAGIGYTYDEIRDAFIVPKPYDSWVLDEETCRWNAPIDHPEDGGIYNWNEEVKQWEKDDSPS